MKGSRTGALRLLPLAVLAVGVAMGVTACDDDSDSAGASTASTVTETVTRTTTATTSTTAPSTEAAKVDTLTKSLQEDLAAAGFYRGEITGIYDAATTAAVKAFQESAGLTQDGIAGAQTHLALDFELGRTSSNTVKVLQSGLTDLCHYSGPINGVYTSATEAAVREFQQDVGITVDGQFGPQTAVALIREHPNRPSSCTSTPATPEATHTGPATPTATVTVRGPSYSKTFEVTRCVPSGETGVALDGTAAGGFTIRIAVPSNTGTLAIGGGTEQDGINLTGTVTELSVGDAGDIRGTGSFSESPAGSGSPRFTIVGRCA